MFDFFNRCKAYTVPTLMAAGKAGGTAIVMTSNDFLTISPADAPTLTEHARTYSDVQQHKQFMMSIDRSIVVSV